MVNSENWRTLFNISAAFFAQSKEVNYELPVKFSDQSNQEKLNAPSSHFTLSTAAMNATKVRRQQFHLKLEGLRSKVDSLQALYAQQHY